MCRSVCLLSTTQVFVFGCKCVSCVFLRNIFDRQIEIAPLSQEDIFKHLDLYFGAANNVVSLSDKSSQLKSSLLNNQDILGYTTNLKNLNRLCGLLEEGGPEEDTILESLFNSFSSWSLQSAYGLWGLSSLEVSSTVFACGP